ncbi:hypothetical protein CYG48_02365 [Neorhizobium sp. SOG26]|uniref:class I SAM-dependent methyltransferase n=1 Tax=Neorhizobium sp. SOG26 TaxID=2060726 RepID=UPI000E57B0EF|nr:class I SAM-dependent methyltransferase [Neorhizobium sp. SOG26]AXV14652.1 hypothetical protein CYG48_02365 [Neorhizobium sp. SOG26]
MTGDTAVDDFIRDEAAAARAFPFGRLAYMHPNYLAPSAWTEHVPFAFWLIEAVKPKMFVELGTHFGVSYFAFCQAIEKLDLGAQAVAIDSWKGDEHAGEYGPEVFDSVQRHNSQCYSHFSTLLKSSFEESLAYFVDGSIDLLHIDGMHTYESVRSDFESWLPKMSQRGVVIFHDTCVRERSFGVFRLFDELKQVYPSFEFHHGHGLGVVGVGPEQTWQMGRLFEAGEKNHERRELLAFFSALGRGVRSMYRADVHETAKRQLAREGDKHRLAAEAAEQKVVIIGDDLQKARTELDQTKANWDRASAKVEQLSGDVADLREVVRDLREKLDQATLALTQQSTDAERAVAELATATKLLAEEKELAARNEAALTERFQEIASLTQLLQEEEKRAAQFREQVRLRDSKIKDLTGQLEAAGGPRDMFGRQAGEALPGCGTVAGLELGRAIKHVVRLSWFWRFIPSRLRIKRQITLLKETGLFDSNWYLETYKDVARAGIDPAMHYILHGANEGREPNPVLQRSRGGLTPAVSKDVEVT